MSLTEHQLYLLIDNDYDIGKFYTALNARDDDNTNWFTYYDNNIAGNKGHIEWIRGLLDTWQNADQYEREQIIKDKVALSDKSLQDEIDEDKVHVRKLSKVIHEVTTMASEGKFDPRYIQESNLMTELLEEITDINEEVSECGDSLVGDDINYSKELARYDQLLIDELELCEKSVVEDTENKALMEERQQWLCDTFDISEEEKQEIIDKYGR